MRPGIFEEKSNNHLKEVTVKIRERYRASTYAQLEETASGCEFTGRMRNGG